ncbi:hypothetical protein FHETE_11125 [Fusarium heterosporum]|uniref:Uncharacterized protein n=1 Tax=Fusarium heterosporum TaxID=42747 RepID=A0A8H5SQM2_FUSHE|nr:hypothetical protein FHETE_11125 [Fusarium heterosporum]
MAGRRVEDRTESSGTFDRRDDRGSVDYRDRSSERYRGSPRELFPDREREAGSSRGQHAKRHSERPSSKRPINAGEHGSRISSNVPNGPRASKPSQHAIMELLGDMAYHRSQFIHADAKLRKTKSELSQSATRPTEFASVEDIKRKELQRCEDEKKKQESKLVPIYQKLQMNFDSLVKQLLQQPSPVISDTPHITPSPTKRTQGSISELEPRFTELRNEIATLMEGHVQRELEKFRKSDNSEVQGLRNNLNEEKQKTQLLAGKLEEGQRKNQLLEERLNQLEQKIDGIHSTTALRIFTEVDKKLDTKLSSFDDKFSKSLSSTGEEIQQLRKSSEDHTTQLANLKHSASIVAKSSTASPNTAITATVEQMKKTVDIQGHTIKFLQNKHDSAVLKIEKLQILTDSNKVDADHNGELLKTQSAVVAEQGKKQDSLEKGIESMNSTYHDQEKKYKELDGIVVGLGSTIRGLSQGHESLLADMTALKSSFRDRKKLEDTQASKIDSLEVIVGEQQKRGDVQEQRVSSLQDAAVGWSLQEFRRLTERVQGLPPTTDLKRLLEELPTLVEMEKLLAEQPPVAELKQLLMDVPKLRKSMSEVMARPSRTPTPTPMTRDMVLQMVKHEVVKSEVDLKSGLTEKFQGIAKSWGVLIDKAHTGTSKCEGDVTRLDERVAEIDKALRKHQEEASERSSEIDKALKESRKEASDTSETLQRLFREQTAEVNSLKGSIAMAFRDVDKARKEAKVGTDDVQFQLAHMTEWAKNFGSKQWHESVAQQIAAYVPAHFAGQLDSIATRVSTLESRGNDSEVVNKRRKGMNGSPLIVGGTH